MTKIEILLAVIAIVQVWRLVSLVKPLSKKAHFKQKQQGTERMAWDLEFKVFKTKEIREEIRTEYDFMKQRVDSFNKQLEKLDKKKDKEEFDKTTDTLALAERDRDRLEGQIAQLDLEMNGSKPTNQYPDGVQGIYDQIDSLRELVGMLKSWSKKV